MLSLILCLCLAASLLMGLSAQPGELRRPTDAVWICASPPRFDAAGAARRVRYRNSSWNSVSISGMVSTQSSMLCTPYTLVS